MSDPASRRATLAFLGDIMLGRLVAQCLSIHEPEWVWGDLLDVLRGADAVFANLECAVTDSQEQWRRTPTPFHFRADPAAAAALTAGNVRFVSLANNHALDCESGGLMDTMRHLDDAGIAWAGAGVNAAEAARPAFVQAGPLKVAVFGVTDNMPEAGATGSAPGVFHVDAEKRSDLPAQADFANARAQGADIVVVSAHLGPNMVSQPSQKLRDYKRRLIERGADIVHGHSAHVIQGVERRGRGVILHDTGDFIDDYALEPQFRNDLSFVFLLDVDTSGVRSIRLLPVRLRLARAERATGRDADWICERMLKLSQAFGVRFQRTRDGLRLEL